MGFKEGTGQVFPKDDQGNRLFSEVNYLETYAVLFFFIFIILKRNFFLSFYFIKGYGGAGKRGQSKIDRCE